MHKTHQGNIGAIGPYKGYMGTVEADFVSNVLHGSVIGIKDVITYEGTTLQELEKAFIASVNDYLAYCKEQGESPERPYSGKFNLRINSHLHKELSLEAALKGLSLNTYIEQILLSRNQYSIPHFKTLMASENTDF